SEVLEAIENVILNVLKSLAKKQAPVLTLANRSDWRNIDSNAQNIVYDLQDGAEQFLRNQKLSTNRGFVAGNLSYTEEDGTKVNCSCGATAVTVPSNVQGIKSSLNVEDLYSHAKFILIVEKDATFQRLLDDEFCLKSAPCIMITGRGIPDLNTRLLVRKLWDTFQVPIFTLVDADPHGVEIMCIYKYGSVSMSFEAHQLTVPCIKWLGLLPSDIERSVIPQKEKKPSPPQ
ncbi:hypothetical protein ASZ78_011851, partial [Callipepla squamata]